jgi:hypothetical protein
MNEAEQFEIVLGELRSLFRRITDLAEHVYVIGGQALALEAKARGGSGVIEVETDTGVRLTRGFSLEPDLLLDIDAMSARADVVTDALKELGFTRYRDFDWRKRIDDTVICIELFRAESSDPTNAPSGMIPLPLADEAMARTNQLRIALEGGDLTVAVPDPVGFLQLKVDAKNRLRPHENKDCFDIYAYLRLQTAATVRSALVAAGTRGGELAAYLRRLFGTPTSPGVQDVLIYAATLGPQDRDLLARAVVDEIARVTEGWPTSPL